MGLKEEFEEHTTLAFTLPESTTHENKLILYGLFKQATVGPVNTSRPGMFNMKERYKWDFWKANEAKTKDEAMSDYITKVKSPGRAGCFLLKFMVLQFNNKSDIVCIVCVIVVICCFCMMTLLVLLITVS